MVYSSTTLYDTLAKIAVEAGRLNGYCTNINLNNKEMTITTRIIRTSLILQFLLCGLFTFGQNATTPLSIHQSVQSHTDAIFDSLVKIRRDFHMHPEISGKEKRTSEEIAAYLLSLGLEVKTGVGGYGVVGILNTGRAGKRIAWRADIDAMPSDNPDVVDFPSKNEGVRHICGHDVNTTIALGIANVMASQKERLTGTVYFIFQPSEETYTGAKAMIDDGLFNIINPDEIYGLHIAPSPITVISTKPEWMFADYKTIEVSYENSNKNDAIVQYTKELISSLQNIAPDSEFWDFRNILDPNIGLASPNTIYRDYLTVHPGSFKVKETNKEISISAFVGSSVIEKLDSIVPLLKQKIDKSKYAKELNGVAYSVERTNLYNDKDLTKNALNTIAKLYGAENTVLLYGEMPDGRGDDFAYYQEHVPGVYFYLGGSNFEKEIVSMPHAPNFEVDENCIKTGVNYFTSLIIERLNNSGQLSKI